MVLLLNYLPWIIITLGVFACYKSAKVKSDKKRTKALFTSIIGTLVALLVLQGLTTGYIPKQRSSEVKIPAPSFEATEAEIQNRLRSPERLGAESEARFNEKMDWRKHKREEELKSSSAAPTE